VFRNANRFVRPPTKRHGQLPVRCLRKTTAPEYTVQTSSWLAGFWRWTTHSVPLRFRLFRRGCRHDGQHEKPRLHKTSRVTGRCPANHREFWVVLVPKTKPAHIQSNFMGVSFFHLTLADGKTMRSICAGVCPRSPACTPRFLHALSAIPSWCTLSWRFRHGGLKNENRRRDSRHHQYFTRFGVSKPSWIWRFVVKCR
jgi:hypothetical protein